MTATEPREATYLHAATHDRIANLWFSRQIFRKLCGADWPTARWETEVELRALLRLAREARRTAAAEPDPITVAKASAFDHYSAVVPLLFTEAENRAMWGDR